MAQGKPYSEHDVAELFGLLGPERTLDRLQRPCISFNVTKAVEQRFRDMKATASFLAGLRGTCKKLPETDRPKRHEPVRQRPVERVEPPPPPPPPPPPDSSEIKAQQMTADSLKERVGITLPGVPPTPGFETLNARVTTFRFFEGPNPGPPLGSRQYADTFDVAAARYIYAELELDYVGPSDLTTFSLGCNFEREGSGVPRDVTVNGTRQAGVGTFLSSFGLGWDTPGHWYPGRYFVECAFGGKPVMRQTFEVVGVTSESAFDAGKAAEAAGNMAEAAKNYAIADSLAPDSHVIAYALGNARAKVGQTDGAIAAYRQAVKLLPSNQLYHKTLSEYLRDSQRTEEAEVAFKEWVAVEPDNAWLRGQHAILLLSLGRQDEAIAEYDAAARIAPSEPFYAFRAAQLRKQFGKKF